jgi:hypothetical protein
VDLSGRAVLSGTGILLQNSGVKSGLYCVYVQRGGQLGNPFHIVFAGNSRFGHNKHGTGLIGTVEQQNVRLNRKGQVGRSCFSGTTLAAGNIYGHNYNF